MRYWCIIKTALITRRKLAGVMAKLGPLSEQGGMQKFLKNVEHSNSLNGFVQDLACAITDYQVCVTNPTMRNNSCFI